MARKSFNREQVSAALQQANIPKEQQDAALAALTGEAPAPKRTRGSGAPAAPSTSFTL